MRPSSHAASIAPLLAIVLAPALCGGQVRQREPRLPPPSIVEYQPGSTLVVPEHEVPRARFPAVDFHGHPPNLSSTEAIIRVVAAMDALNLQVMVQARPSSGQRLISQIEGVRAAGHEDRFVVLRTPPRGVLRLRPRDQSARVT